MSPRACEGPCCAENAHELFPDSIGVIGAPEDGDGLVLEYFDERGALTLAASRP